MSAAHAAALAGSDTEKMTREQPKKTVKIISAFVLFQIYKIPNL